MFRVHYRYHLFAHPRNTHTHALIHTYTHFLWLYASTCTNSHTHVHTYSISFFDFSTSKIDCSSGSKTKNAISSFSSYFHLKNGFSDSLPFFPCYHWCYKQKSISDKQTTITGEIWKTQTLLGLGFFDHGLNFLFLDLCNENTLLRVLWKQILIFLCLIFYW